MLISAFMLMATSVSLSEILGMGVGAVGGTQPRDLNRIKSEAFLFFKMLICFLHSVFISGLIILYLRTTTH